MASRRRTKLTVQTLLDGLEVARKSFTSEYEPLPAALREAVKKCSELIKQDRSDIHRNSRRKRSHTILTDLYVQLPDVYILCCLATTPYNLGSLDAGFLSTAIKWWRTVEHPQGLTLIHQKDATILPFNQSKDQQSQLPGL